ncbi:1-aminocyclopropane-1-carboxylate deaminase [Muriicola jejuensis]|uniref:1-aminocyclopropane-1-carboxylate deaminase/D-cysteine desulfhydrase n=1 Tax=Muriicola jejuensis TaxID=504488 RepID=UPI001EF8A666|nr:pyridoxal-phosphate dependent enzyme [Muriicola jejuensis]SMP25088.1 1-aminocyclopropane-1-carboxylate deaminase [Muriicola jejuensis]
MKTPTQEIHLPLLKDGQITLSIRREDMIHPLLSGNKFRKLKYNLEEAKKLGLSTLLTFGGAYSNHIPAVAYAASNHDLKSIGIIRGEELADSWQDNPTLKTASEWGMQFEFVTRQAYRAKETSSFQEKLQKKYGLFYSIPEGGTNLLGIRGCEEILQPEDESFDVICCAVGTGGTLAGISIAAWDHQKVLGFPALKGDFLNSDLKELTPRSNWSLTTDYSFGGYGKVTGELIRFINNFKDETGIPLDPVYTGKMMFGLLDMVRKGDFDKGTRILAIHTGGLQGIMGMNGILKKKNLPLLTV